MENEKRPFRRFGGGLTELSFRDRVLPAGMHPLEVPKLLVCHWGAVLVIDDVLVARGARLDCRDFIRRQGLARFGIDLELIGNDL